MYPAPTLTGGPHRLFRVTLFLLEPVEFCGGVGPFPYESGDARKAFWSPWGLSHRTY
jgi:hypothetical protein